MPPLIIGSGHNGLAAAFYLARAGMKPVVLERREEVGGGAITKELHPGFRVPVLTHEVLLHARIAREMQLERHGLEWIAPEARVFAPRPGGAPVILWEDAARSADSLRAFNAADADAYPAFLTAVEGVCSVIATLLTEAPPSLEKPGAGDVWTLIRSARRFRAIGRRDAYRLLRWGPMAAADLVHEWFTDDLLCAALAGPGVSGTMLGPRSAGSALVMLLRQAHAQLAGGSRRVRGGPGALTRAMAAAAVEAGAEIRTGQRVERIVIRNQRVSGVIVDGREVAADVVLSSVDPKSTFLELVGPAELPPGFALRVRNYRAHGTVAKINLALSALPRFSGADGHAAALSGRIHIGPGIDYMERAFDRAKYGEYSPQPWLDVTIPSLADDSLTRPGTHVASIYVHCAPYRLRTGSWTAARNALLDTVLDTLELFAPGLRSLIVAAQVITPDDLEQEYGFPGGHIFHGELALDQLFMMRPMLGFSRYNSPFGGLYLCGAGTHPGGFLTAASGRLAAREIIARR